MELKEDKEVVYRKESELFNLAADYYDKYRPSYPKEIIDILIKKAKITNLSSILEIGSGSGKATELLADISCRICCVEPGADLVAKGREKFIANPKIRFNCSRFEEFESTDGYDIICAFQSFHWLPQPIGFQKCAERLNEKGYLALIWNMYITYDNDFDNSLSELSSKYGGFADFLDEKKCNNRIKSIVESIDNCKLFGNVSVYKQLWEQAYTADEYFGFCLTGNSFIQKSDIEKNSAYKEIRKLAEKNGGMIIRPYLCVLYLTTKR